MNYQTLIIRALLLLFLAGCANTSERKVIVDVPEKEQLRDSIDRKSPILDTVRTAYSIQIGNDKALITVKKIMRNKPDHFVIELDYRNEKAFSVYADKATLIDSTIRPFFLDTLLLDYTQGATLMSVKYSAIRGSSLNFSAVLKNEEWQKQVEGRFNVFYDPARRGTIYGWITDTVYDINSAK